MSTKSRVAALDPTALEQTGLDPQQIQKEIEAAMRQAQSVSTSSTSTSSSTPPVSTSMSSTSPSTPSAPPPPQKLEPWKLDPTYIEQTGLDPRQVAKRIETAIKSVMQPPSPPPASTSSTSLAPGAGTGRRWPSIIDIIRSLDPTTADQSSVVNFYNIFRNIQLGVWTSGGQPSGGGSNDRDYTKGRGLWGSSVSQQPPSDTHVAPIPADYMLGQRNPENVVNRLSTAYDALRKELEQTVSKYSDVLQYSGSTIDMSRELKEKLDRYSRALEELKNAEGQQIQDVLNRYSDVLTYDPSTGRVTPSSDLAAMWSRYEQAVQEVSKYTSALSTVAGMIPTFAQQLPVATVTFQTFDRAQNKWVEVGGETPIYVRDEKMREEILNWMRQQGVDEQGNPKVKVTAFFDQNKPVVYIYNDRDEGYIIFPATGEVRRARGVSGMVEDTAKAIWYSSLTDEEKKKVETWSEVQRREAEIANLPPGLRELYAALLGAGRFAVITPAIDVVTRWIKGEDPTKGLEEFEKEAAAAAQASPLAHSIGQAVGFAGAAGLTAEGLLAKGAALGASGIGNQLLAGLRSTLKPTIIGATTGATFGAVEGALTGRDPLAEATKFGTLGLLTGLGEVPREQLIAGGLVGGLVGASTAKKYGAEKGLEAGSAAFFLPIVTPMERGIGGITMETAVARRPRPAVGLTSEPIPAVEARYTQIVRGLASQARSRMEAKPEPGLTPDDVVDIAAQLRFNPAEQRGFFQSIMEDAVMKIRGGGDADVVIAQLRVIRQKLDPVSRMRFDEALRQYGLTEVKTAAPEYSLREEEAQKLARLFRREPKYALTDESAKLLDQFLKPRQEPQYALTDEAAQRLNQFLRMEQKPSSRPVVEQQPAALRRRVRYADRQEPWFALPDKTTVGASTEPVGRAELEVSAKPSPAPTARTEIERQEPGVGLKSVLEYALRPKAEAPPEVALTPEAQQVLRQAREIGRKLWEIDTALKAGILPPPTPEDERRPFEAKPPTTPQVETPPPSGEPPDKEWKPFAVKPPYIPTEPPPTVNPPLPTLYTPERTSQYEPTSVPTTTTPPPTAEVPPPPTYTPMPTYNTTPVNTPQVPPPKDIPTYDVSPVPQPTPPPESLPPGWWRLIPPDIFAEDNKGEGAYKVQTGKRQILALA